MDWQNPSNPRYSYQVAGFPVITNRPAADSDRLCSLGDPVEVIFISQATNGPTSGDHQDNDSTNEIWHFLPDGMVGHAYIRGDGRAVLIQEPVGEKLNYPAQLRRVVPFAAALQGRIILHASAVHNRQAVFAFLGASGVGKSTLTKQLATMDYSVVADDLLLCLIDGDRVTVCLANDSTTSEIALPLGAMYFLSRDIHRQQPHCKGLTKMQSYQELLNHGFGELPVAELWQNQFISYHQIVMQVPGFMLQEPNDAARLAELGAFVSRHFVSLSYDRDKTILEVDKGGMF